MNQTPARPFDFDHAVRIQYENEGSGAYGIGYLITGLVLLVGGLVATFLVSGEGAKIACLALGLLAGGGVTFLSLSTRLDKTVNMFRKARRHIVNNGKMYIGVIFDVACVEEEHDQSISSLEMTFGLAAGVFSARDAVDTVSRVISDQGSVEPHYCYCVQYVDDKNVTKVVETYTVKNHSLNNIGKRCAVYEYNGKVIVDDVEDGDLIRRPIRWDDF